MDYKASLIHTLKSYQQKDYKFPFKVKAYQTVLVEITNIHNPITSYQHIAHIKGIGESIRKKLEKVFSQEEEKESIMLPSLFDIFGKIYGVGPVKIAEIIKLGIHNIDDLRNYVNSHPKFFNDKQNIGLRYYDDLIERIPRNEIEYHRAIFTKYIGEKHFDIVGSYRRNAQDSSDIDILLHNSIQLSQLVTKLQLNGYITEILALGPHKCMAICKLGHNPYRRIDLLSTPDSEYAYSLLYFTGSSTFNIAFRQYCSTKGYRLNEHTLIHNLHNTHIPHMNTEEDIFRFMGLRYIPPHQRINELQIIPM